MFRTIIGLVHYSHLSYAFVLPSVVEVFVEWGGRQVHILKKEKCISYMCKCIRCVSWTVVTVCIIEEPCCTGFYTICHDPALLTMWLLFWINNSISINVRENLCMISGLCLEVNENSVFFWVITQQIAVIA
jgi:hypothetical protein